MFEHCDGQTQQHGYYTDSSSGEPLAQVSYKCSIKFVQNSNANKSCSILKFNTKSRKRKIICQAFCNKSPSNHTKTLASFLGKLYSHRSAVPLQKTCFSQNEILCIETIDTCTYILRQQTAKAMFV